MAKSLDDLITEGVAERRVLVRSDLNVPLDGSTVTDDGRVRASLPVLDKLTDAGARVIVMAHLGRPKGTVDPKYSIKPAADRLAELLDACRAGPKSAHDALPVLFKRPLDLHQTTFAMGESVAHLHALWYDGRVRRERAADGVWRFSAT